MSTYQRIALLTAVVSIGGPACEPIMSAEPKTPSRAPSEQPEARDETTMARFSRECKAGRKESCSMAAHAYQHGEAPVSAPGEIVVRDLTRAAYYWSEGCELGHMWCCENLADAKHKGDGVKKDDAEAARLYARVCEGPIETATRFACTSLGDLYVGGKGVPFDFRKGISLLRKACSLGAEYGCQLRDLYAGTGLVSKTTAPEGSLGFTFGWSKEIAQKACAERHGRWMASGGKTGATTMLCEMHVGVLDRDAIVGLEFVDGRLATIWAGYNVDEGTAMTEYVRIVNMLTKIYGVSSLRTFEVLDGCARRSLTACIKENQANFSIYWEFGNHDSSVTHHLIVDKDEKIVAMLVYVSPAGMKAAGHPGL